MSNADKRLMSEAEFDALLQNGLPELPPDDVAQDVTPWKKAMNRVLAGMALNAITLNFLWLNYILPAAGVILMLLGLRMLRRENKWFGCCYAVTVMRTVCVILTLILNATVIRSAVYNSVVTALNLILMFLLFFCLWKGIKDVRRKVGMPPEAGGAAALMVWYALVCVLAFVRYNGIIISLILIISYVLIIRNLFKASRELDEAGYAVCPCSVRVPDAGAAAAIAMIITAGTVCGWLLWGSYPMKWNERQTAYDAQTADIKEQLIRLGFPEEVLCDLNAEDINDCDNASYVLSKVYDHPVNDGRQVKEYSDAGFHYSTVYDTKELRITSVAVKLGGEREKWKIFHHFLWTENTGFYGTECIQLWPAYRLYEGWSADGDVSGGVLYDADGKTFYSPYYYLGNKTYSYDSIIWGEQTSTDIFAAFSLPRKGENRRGYLSYTVKEMQHGYMIDAWINYTHQKSPLQYPVKTAMEERMEGGFGGFGFDSTFITVQDALQFHTAYDTPKPLF